jgi:signal transduction histidine kinase
LEGRLDDVRASTKARRGLARLSGLVNDILDVARVEQGLLVVDARATSLVPLVEEVVGLLSSQTQPIVVEAREHVAAVVDPARVRQCLENILVNAIKHSPERSPVNVVVARLATASGDVARIDVVDQGPGVPPDILPFIFDRFVSRPGPRNQTGLGLGLFLARRIALLHGGELAVESERQRGARFTLTLPCGDTERA